MHPKERPQMCRPTYRVADKMYKVQFSEGTIFQPEVIIL